MYPTDAIDRALYGIADRVVRCAVYARRYATTDAERTCREYAIAEEAVRCFDDILNCRPFSECRECLPSPLVMLAIGRLNRAYHAAGKWADLARGELRCENCRRPMDPDQYGGDGMCFHCYHAEEAA